MQKLENFLKTKLGKLLVAIISLLVIIGLIILLIHNLNQDDFTENSQKIDDPSGLDVYSSNAEKEGEDTTTIVIGFNVFYDFGFSAIQQEKIYNEIKNFIDENYPSAATVSYEKNSFKYTEEDEASKSEFKIITDTKKEFLVTLDTNYSYDEITIIITEL